MPTIVEDVDLERLVEELHAIDGGGGDEPVPEEEGGDPTPPDQWPLVPAILVAVAVAALLTFFGMVTQFWANMAGAQLPGA